MGKSLFLDGMRSRGWMEISGLKQAFSVKCYRVNVSGFVGHTVSAQLFTEQVSVLLYNEMYVFLKIIALYRNAQ